VARAAEQGRGAVGATPDHRRGAAAVEFDGLGDPPGEEEVGEFSVGHPEAITRLLAVDDKEDEPAMREVQPHGRSRIRGAIGERNGFVLSRRNGFVLLPRENGFDSSRRSGLVLSR
jgi:hypothetical protein